MDYQKPQIKTESIRLRIKADVPADYFHQPMAIARGPDGVVYLRIGDDIYEGRAVLENTDGTAVHFDVAEISSNEAEGATASGRLANFAVSDFEYQFLPLGRMSSPTPKETEEAAVKMEMDIEFPDLNFTETGASSVAGLIGQNFTDAEKAKDFQCLPLSTG